MSRVGGYLRQHHLGLIAVFIALTGTAVVATAAQKSSNQVNACSSKETGALSLRKGNKCPAGTKPLSWGVQGPQGAPGPAGAQGAQGSQGPAGSARAYGRVLPDGTMVISTGATVTHPSTGVYCLSISGASPSQVPIMVTTDYQSGGSSSGLAELSAGADPLLPNASSNAVVQWDALNETCSAGQFEVQTFQQQVKPFENQISVLNVADSGFAFLLP